MEYGKVRMADGGGRTVSSLILGTALFGSAIARDRAFEMMDIFFEHGGNALDTARVYAAWLPNGIDASERTVGEWIRSRGADKDVFLITKGAHPDIGGDLHLPRLSREEIDGDIMRSMEVLGARIDLYYLHRDDRFRPVSDIMTSLNRLTDMGYIGAIGASNWRADRIAEANAWAAENNAAEFTASVIQFGSNFNRQTRIMETVYRERAPQENAALAICLIVIIGDMPDILAGTQPSDIQNKLVK